MEWWNNGMSKIPSSAGLIFKEFFHLLSSISRRIFPIDHCHIFPKPIIPLFHYSNWGAAPKFKGGKHAKSQIFS